MKQKILLFMLLVMAVPVTIMAQNVEIKKIKYELNSYNCIAYANSLSENFSDSVLVIPSTVSYNGKNYKVKYINIKGNEHLKYVTLPDSVKIEDGAFSDCKELNIIINDINSWYTIDKEIAAFVEFGWVSYLGIETVEKHCLYRLFDKNNTEITDVVIPSDIDYHKANFNFCILNSITFPNGSLSWRVHNPIVKYCQMKSIILPNDVEGGIGGFGGCWELESVTLPNGVTSIGDKAFQQCRKLESINIPNGVTNIGDYAFSGCENLKSIIIPSSVKYIGSGAFSGCANLKSIIIENPDVSIGHEAFWSIPEDAKIKLGSKEIKASKLEGSLAYQNKVSEERKTQTAAAEKEYDAKVRQLEKRMGISDSPRLNEVIKAGRSFSTVKEYLKLVNDRFSFKLSIDKGARKCYDMYGPSGSGFISSIVKKGYIWVNNGKITSVAWR